MNKGIDKTIIGKRFGRLVVQDIDENKTKETGSTILICECDCGNMASVYRNHLTSGATSSCGCLRKEEFSKRLTKHGMAGTKIYRVWSGMIERCYYIKHKTYKEYGGRGIWVCNEWKDKENGFLSFYEWAKENEYEEGLTLDRINNDSGYYPENCRWVNRSVQGYNRRNTVIVEINGVSHNLKEWSEILNIRLPTLRDQYYDGRFP